MIYYFSATGNSRQVYPEVPPRVEYSLTEQGKTLLPALDELYRWADAQMHAG